MCDICLSSLQIKCLQILFLIEDFEKYIVFFLLMSYTIIQIYLHAHAGTFKSLQSFKVNKDVDYDRLL